MPRPEACCSSSEDIIELQDITLSPIASLRHHHFHASTISSYESSTAAVEQMEQKFPPSFRIARTYGTTTRCGLRYRSATAQTPAHIHGNKCPQSHRPRMFHAIRRGANLLKKSIPKIEDVNVIDKYSRIIFPISFLAFNAGYWIFYALE